jgi:hypothetical protein
VFENIAQVIATHWQVSVAAVIVVLAILGLRSAR